MSLIERLKPKTNTIKSMLCVVGTKILDVESTIPIVSIVGSSGEFNPVMRAVIEEAGVEGFRTVSYLASAGIAYFLRDNQKAWATMSCIQAYFAFHNIIQYSLHNLNQMPSL